MQKIKKGLMIKLKDTLNFLGSRIAFMLAGALMVLTGYTVHAVTSGQALTATLWNDIGFHFITPSTFYSGAGPVNWTSVNAVPYGIPANANAIVIQGDCAISSPDSGDIDAYIYIGDGVTNRTLLRGRSAASGDNVAASGYGVFPLSSGTFTYYVDNPGFDGGCVLNIVGYFYR